MARLETIEVKITADVSGFIEAMQEINDTIHDKFWWMFYEEDIAESHGDAEDVWV